jgi:hypothetical protein
MNTKNLVTYGLIAVIAFFIIKEVLKSIKGSVKDTIGGSTIGDMLGINTEASGTAAANLLALKYLTEGYFQAASNKYNNANYQLIAVNYEEAAQIADNLINADSWMPFGINDKNTMALTEIRKIQNMVQALQVAHIYYVRTGKDLNIGLQFLNNQTIVLANDWLAKLPTGVIDKTTGKELQFSQISI